MGISGEAEASVAACNLHATAPPRKALGAARPAVAVKWRDDPYLYNADGSMPMTGLAPASICAASACTCGSSFATKNRAVASFDAATPPLVPYIPAATIAIRTHIHAVAATPNIRR